MSDHHSTQVMPTWIAAARNMLWQARFKMEPWMDYLRHIRTLNPEFYASNSANRNKVLDAVAVCLDLLDYIEASPDADDTPPKARTVAAGLLYVNHRLGVMEQELRRQLPAENDAVTGDS